ncbi:AAA family ATPase [Candidatus Gracilibacteria bacterium]|nr:AAA family ATPase [Candidatus Gracilibacteria bacterium]
MKFQHIKIKNFRNLQNVDLELGNINVLTGKNGSGKTNFLNSIAHFLEMTGKIGKQFSPFFDSNITTIGKGKSITHFEATLNNVTGLVSTTYGSNKNKGSSLYLPNQVIFSNKIRGSNYLSEEQSYTFIGWKEEIEDTDIDGDILSAIRNKKPIRFPTIVDKINYSRDFKVSSKGDITLSIQKTETIEKQEEKIKSDEFASFLLSRFGESIVYSFFKKRSDDTWVNDVSSRAIVEYVTKAPPNQIYDEIIKRMDKKNKDTYVSRGDFKDSVFPFLIADIQINKDQFESFKNDLSLYTNGLIEEVYVKNGGDNEVKVGTDGVIYVRTPNAPKNLSSISSGSAILIFFITLKNWLSLSDKHRSYRIPSVLLFDEIDSCIHPTLLGGFVEVLRAISRNTQLIFTTHSPTFIDLFEKTEIYYIKPKEKIEKIMQNRSDIFSYSDIISKINIEDKQEFFDTRNSELFINGLIDSLYPCD